MERPDHKIRFERLIPVYLFFICDSSGIIGTETINRLNHSMPDTFRKTGELFGDSATFKAFVRVLAYSDAAVWLNLDNIPPSSYVWKELHARGRSNLGAAFTRLAKALRLRENRGLMRADGPVPVIVLISGSVPDDDWENGLETMNRQYWGEHSLRFSITLESGSDEVTTRFLDINNNFLHRMTVDQIDELPARILAALNERHFLTDDG
jgi:uncharacterized protein YegL